MSARAGLLGLAGAAFLAGAASPAHARADLDWHDPRRQPHDARAAADDSDEYAWRLFVAVNFPAASPTQGEDTPAVWETWVNVADIFRDDGGDPGPYVYRPAASVADSHRFDTRSLKDLSNLKHIVGGRMVPLTDPVSNARRLTEVRLNKAAYDYIRSHELYNLDGQLQVLARRERVRFPAASTQVKAKWRPICADERWRYHSVTVRLADGSTRLFGLTALHIVTKDLPTWFWATFEHVDNPSLDDADGWTMPSTDRFACGAAPPDCNRAPRDIGLDSTVWQFYRLRGTLTRFTSADGKPLRLANSELEAGLQSTSSCITCHARSSIGLVAGSPVRLPIFDAPPPEASADPTARRGFIGLPQAAWFEVGEAGEGARRGFQPLDFVWSLAKAQPKRGT